MLRLKTILTIFIIWFSVTTTFSQNQVCVSSGSPNINLDLIDFNSCDDPLTYDITNSSNVANCDDCGAINGPFSSSETITVTIYENGIQCNQQNLSVIFLDASINYIAENAPNCNQFTFDATTSSSVNSYQWDFDGDGTPDSIDPNPTWTFSSNGNQTVELTVFSSNGNCSYSTNTVLFVDGPWADLSFFGNLEGDSEFENLGTVNFNGNACTVPFCVDDIENIHCIQMSEIVHANTGINSQFQIWLDGTSIFNENFGPVNFEYCFPADFSGYSTIEFQITDNNGCISIVSCEVYVAEDSFPSASVNIDIPNDEGFCIGEVVEFEIEADDSNPNDLTYIIAIDCPNLDFNEIIAPVLLDTLYLAPGEVYSGEWIIETSSCHCFPSGQFSVYTFMDSPCRDHFPGGTDPFTVNLDSDAGFSAPETLCQFDSETFSWANSNETESGICDADPIWTIIAPGETDPVEVSDDPEFTYQFTEIGIYTICLEIEADCQLSSSVVCYDICVETPLTSADLDVTWPDITTISCVGATYQPSVFVLAPFCGELNYNWTTNPSVGTTITGQSTTNPTITFDQKGDYTVYVTVFSSLNCGTGSQNMGTFEIGGPPQVELLEASIGGCPDQPLCIDAAFCVDDCNSTFNNASVTIYQGSISPTCDYSGMPIIWSDTNNPNVNFPFDMLGMDCSTSNTPCDFVWDVSSDADGNYIAVVEVENACGTSIHCTAITISPSSIPNIDITSSVCLGETVDPTLTNFSLCDWYVGGSLIWEPGDNPFVVSSTIDISISCSSSGCPFEVSHQITVNPSPSVNITGTLGICANDSTELTANTSESDIEWYDLPCSSITSGSIPISTQSNLFVSSPGTFSVVVTNDTGCSICSEVQITVDSSPSFNCSLESYCENENPTEIDLSCLTIPAGANPPIWDVEQGGDNVANDIGTAYTVGELIDDYSGTIDNNTVFDFTYEWESDLGCLYTNTFEVEILNEGVNLDTNTVCSNEVLILNEANNGDWILDGMPASAGVGYNGNSFTWTPSDADSGGPYTLEFNPNGGCANNIITINVNLSPTVSLNINGGELCGGGTLELEASAGFDSYVWYDDECNEGSIVAGESTNTFNTSDSGIFSIVVTDENGCNACDFVNVSEDAGPSFNCTDEQYCENEINEFIDLSCLTIPDGNNDIIWYNVIEEDTINFDVQSPYSVQNILDDLGQELSSNSDFQISYYWLSDSGCEYSDSLTITILNEGIDTTDINVCSGEAINITPDGSAGIWQYDILALPNVTTNSTDFEWTTDITDSGVQYDVFYESGAGCSSYQYYLEVYGTPEGAVTPDMNELCIENSINITLNPGSATNENLTYVYPNDTIQLDPTNPIFDPTNLGLETSDDGNLIYIGWSDYPTTSGNLTCLFSTTVALEIIDQPESLFFPATLCEGDEFEPTVCLDPYIDSFELIINDTTYSTCPLEFGNLNGTVSYELSAFYGGGLNCMVDTNGTIAIQEQLILEFTTAMDSCTAEATINFDVLSGSINGINVNPPGDFVNNIPNQTVILNINDPLDDQTYNFDFSIDDGGCDVLDYNFAGLYIAPLNPIIFIEPGPFCSGQLIDFSLTQTGSSNLDSIVVFPGNGDSIYTWTDNYNNPIEFTYNSPLDSTLMTIGFHLYNQCHDTLVEEDFIVEPPTLAVNIDPLFTACPGTEVDLTPQLLGTYTNFIIETEDGFNLSLVEAPFLFQVNTNQAAGIYDIQMTFEANCGDPIVITTAIEVYDSPNSEITSTLQCSGLLSNFSVVTSSLTETYQWLIEGQTQFGSDIGFVFGSSGEYPILLETTNTDGCTSTEEIIVEINGIDAVIPFDPIGQCDNLDQELTVFIEPDQSVIWTITNNVNTNIEQYFVNGQMVHFFNTSNIFSAEYQIIVEVIDPMGCSSVQSTNISIYPDGSATIEYFNDTVSNWELVNAAKVIELDLDCNEKEIRFRDGTYSNSCNWFTSLNECQSGQIASCPEFVYCANSDNNGILQLSTVNSYGCPASAQIDIISFCGEELLLYAPNAVTPNDDGINDYFWVYGTNIDLDRFSLQIFDRWGELFYESHDIDKPWLGNMNDGEYYVPDGVYNYIIVAYSKKTGIKKTVNGIVTVIR